MFASPFDRNVAFVVLSNTTAGDQTLPPAEMHLLNPKATPKAVQRFQLGRLAAHAALRQLGGDTDLPVLRGEGGEPLWPEGIVGSITHCAQWAVAAVTQDPAIQALGIDLEGARLIAPEDASLLTFHAEELAWAQSGADARLRLAMLFSAKEAVFKALYPLCRRFIDFTGVRLRWQIDRKAFSVELLSDLCSGLKSGLQFEAASYCVEEFAFSSVVLPANSVHGLRR